MNEKIYFEITKTDGSVEKMEILAKFELEEFKKTYILYCDVKRSHYYAASCLDDSEFTDLDTNLSIEEKNALNNVFLALRGN